jgi:acetyl-CoA carboxylase biotin carboxyl carrier protein
MNQDELRELVEFLKEQGIAEFELEREGFKVRIKRAVEQSVSAVQFVPAPLPTVPQAMPASAVSAPPASEAPKTEVKDEAEGLHTVKSPIVGTFYESPSPGSPAFVKPGDQIQVGQVLCIIEAMKLMNEIESEYAGEVMKRLVSNGQPVEYGQPLFLIRPQS